MAISLSQTSRTATSVTFRVSGFGTTGDRLTGIWIPDLGQWLSLTDALNSGYVLSVSSTASRDGYITVTFYLADIEGLSAWQFQVLKIVNGIETARSEILTTILKFEWDNALTKSSGSKIDITENDFLNLIIFVSYISDWIGGNSNSLSFMPGNIYASDFLEMAQRLYDTAYNLTSSQLPLRSFILGWLGNILDYVNVGGLCYAYYFNEIADSINNFNMSV